MVRPVLSKRKLFNNNKDQFKENEPDQIISSNSETFVTAKTHSHSSSLLLNKSLNSNKKSLAECSSRGDRKRDKDGLSCGDWQRRCESEDGGTTLTSGRTAMPMSERQQIALLMQLSSPSPTNKSERSSRTSPQTPTTPHFGRGGTKRNERGEAPLHVAAIKGDCEKVAQLISQGASVNATDYAGWTALHEACNRGFLVIASLLIKGGADVNAKGLDNDTPLHDACVNNHFQIVRLLLRSGAKTNSANCRGKTPLDVCRSPRILALLEDSNSGDLSFDSPEKDISRIKIQDFELSPYERDYFLSHKSGSPDLPQSFEMSRKTPPNNKIDEKPLAPSSTPSSVLSNPGGGGGTPSGNGASIGNNGRPVSPRVTLRLPHVPRTPDKSQQRTHETKNSSESEDVYEFRCTKEESKVAENEEKTEGGSVKPTEISSSDAKGDKRPRENDPESDEEGKKRRRKEELKESAKNLGRGVVAGSRSSSSEKAPKVGQRASSSNGSNSSKQFSTITTTSTCSNTSTSSLVTSTTITNTSTVSCTSTSDQRKSPSTVSSPKPSTGASKASPEKMDSDSDDTKNENNSGAPKVPPLKIVLAPCGLSEQETSSVNGKNGSNRQLPYVVNSSSGNTEEKEPASSSESKELPTIKEESSTGSSNTSSVVGTMSTNTTNNTPTVSVSSFGSATITLLSSGNGSSSHMNTSTTMSTSSSSTDKGSATRITRSQRGGGGGSGSGSSSSYSEDQVPIKTEPKTEDQITTDVVHPRKRKIKMKEPEMEALPPVTVPEQPVTNCYQMFLKIRKQVERRRKLLFPVQPKPPQGFKDYLMNRCSYVLANSSNSQLSVPLISAPAALTQPLKDLFTEQEQERYKLRLQQLIEKEKLVLSVEQEILRVHGRAARALANQVVPFSVCTILKDEEVYNVISPEQEEKDRNARSRYNGRLFLSWLQDVDDKWEKIKEAMVLRHHNEAESLHAVQKMDWEWKLKESGILEPNSKIQIDELHVPMVQVADFDLLPA